MSQYQKGKTNLGFTKARDSEWQWHQLGRMQVCTLLQTDNYASTPPLSFYRPDALPVTYLTASKHWRRTSFTHNAFVMSISILARGSFSAERSYAIRSVSHEISDGRRVTKWIKLLKSYTKIDVGINRRLQLTPRWRHPIHVLMKQNTNVYWSIAICNWRVTDGRKCHASSAKIEHSAATTREVGEMIRIRPPLTVNSY